MGLKFLHPQLPNAGFQPQKNLAWTENLARPLSHSPFHLKRLRVTIFCGSLMAQSIITSLHHCHCMHMETHLLYFCLNVCCGCHHLQHHLHVAVWIHSFGENSVGSGEFLCLILTIQFSYKNNCCDCLRRQSKYKLAGNTIKILFKMAVIWILIFQWPHIHLEIWAYFLLSFQKWPQAMWLHVHMCMYCIGHFHGTFKSFAAIKPFQFHLPIDFQL